MGNLLNVSGGATSPVRSAGTASSQMSKSEGRIGEKTGEVPPATHGLLVLDDARTDVLEAPTVIGNHKAMLRSLHNLVGYRIHATDGPIGHVEDFILRDDDWMIRYLVVDTRNWLSGKCVLISPEGVRDIGWEEREVWVDVPKQTVEDSPPYDPSAPVNREYEMRIYDYCGRPKYWA